MAVQLADAAEATIRAGAVRDWMAGGVFYTIASTWPNEAIPMLETNWGVHRDSTKPIPVRELITGTINAIFEEKP